MSDTVHLARVVLDAIERAEAGDARAWGTLYSVAESFARAARPIPEPLASVMAERMQAIGYALASPREKDNRAALHAAASPGAKRGRKARPLDVLARYAEDVLQMAGDHPDSADINAALDFMVQCMPFKPGTDEPLYTRQSLLVEVQKLRQARKG